MKIIGIIIASVTVVLLFMVCLVALFYILKKDFDGYDD
jgi:hypothetical protein